MRISISLPKFSMPSPRPARVAVTRPSLSSVPSMAVLPALPDVSALSSEAIERAQTVAAEMIDAAKSSAYLEGVKEAIEALQPNRKRHRGRRMAMTAVAVTATAAVATAAYVLWKRHDHFEADAPVFTSTGGAAAPVAERPVEPPYGDVRDDFMTEAPPHMTTEPGVTIPYMPSEPPAPAVQPTPPAAPGAFQPHTPPVPPAIPTNPPMANAQPEAGSRPSNTPAAPHPSNDSGASMYPSAPPPSARGYFNVPSARASLPNWSTRLP